MKVEISHEDFVKAGGDPSKIDRLKDIVAEVQANAKPGELNPAALVDISDGFKVGPFKARAMTAGVLRILQQIEHPLTRGEETDDIGDVIDLLFVLTHESVPDLVKWAGSGELSEQATMWSFNLDADSMASMQADVEMWIAHASEELNADADDDDGFEKKTSG